MRLVIALLGLVAISTGSPAHAAVLRQAAPARTRGVDAVRRLDVNTLNLFVANDGRIGFDFTGAATGGNWGLLYPSGSATGVLFAAGLWVGAKVAGQARVTSASYDSEYGPGGMIGGTADNPARPAYRVWKVAAWNGNPRDTAHVERTGAELAADPTLDPLVHHGWSEYLANATPYGAPTRTWQLPAPGGGGSTTLVGPDVMGDVMLWSVYNDADPTLHNGYSGSTPPLGLEVRQTVFAFRGADPSERTAFVRWRIMNRGNQTLDSLRVGLWLDPDLGTFFDDFVGCDTTRSLGFAYNATPFDAVYGLHPPAFGVDFVDESFDATRGRTLGMDAFTRIHKSFDPAGADESWLLMNGNFNLPGVGYAGPFHLTGDPVTGTGRLDSYPSDRRMLMSRGRNRLVPGDSLDLTTAMIVAQGSSRLASVNLLRCMDDWVQTFYDQQFPIVRPPVPQCANLLDCPRTPEFFAAQCAGAGDLSTGQLDTLAARVDARAVNLSWPTGAERDAFCTMLADVGDARAAAKREYATLLANVLAQEIPVIPAGSSAIRVDPMLVVSCTALAARTVAELTETAPTHPEFSAVYLNLQFTHPRALEGVNLGLRGFAGGAGPMSEFFGSGLDFSSMPDSFPTVRLDFDRTRPQLAHRYLRLGKASDGGPPPQGRAYLYGGFVPVLFTARDSVSGELLEVAFVERCLTDDAGTILGPTEQPATFDSTWAPDDSPFGGREYLFVARRPYTGAPRPELAQDGAPISGVLPWLYGLVAKKRSPDETIDDGDAFVFRHSVPVSRGADARFLELERQPLSDPQVRLAYENLRDCLASANRGDWLGTTCGESSPLRPALTRVVAEPEHVSLLWSMPPGGHEVLARLSPGEPFWNDVATFDVGATGQVSYEDLDVRPGLRYGYRLGPFGSAGSSVETFVDVPLPSRLVLSALLPNPGSGPRSVRFTLRTFERATLEIIDIAGRRLVKRDMGNLGPGTHTVPVADRFTPGIYLLRLTQGGAHVSAKGIVIR